MNLPAACRGRIPPICAPNGYIIPDQPLPGKKACPESVATGCTCRGKFPEVGQIGYGRGGNSTKSRGGREEDRGNWGK